MLGWNISVHRQANAGGQPAKAGIDRANVLAVWQSGLRGLEWIDALVKTADAIYLGGNGGPSQYTVLTKHLIPAISPSPPYARDVWLHDPDDILTDKWIGKTFIDQRAIDECSPDEWLLVVAWDES